MKEKEFIINQSLIDLYAKPNQNSYLETDCIYGEKFVLTEINKSWAYGFTNADNYKGWVKKKYLSNLINLSHKVVTLTSIIKEEPSIKSKTLGFLPYSSKVNIHTIEKDWSEIIFFNRGLKKLAYIPNKHTDLIGSKIEDYTLIAEKFIGAPYKWGGKTFLGIDCSGLIQICLHDHLKKLPRNSNGQEIYFKNNESTKKLLKRGDLIFWNGHVGIMQNKTHLIHANSFHMSVAVEKLDIAIERIKIKYNLTPRMYSL